MKVKKKAWMKLNVVINVIIYVIKIKKIKIVVYLMN